MTTQPYSMNYQALFSALEMIDVQPLIDECSEPGYNQILCRVSDCVVRLGVQGEFHRHKRDREDEFFFVLQGCSASSSTTRSWN